MNVIKLKKEEREKELKESKEKDKVEVESLGEVLEQMKLGDHNDQ